MVDNGSRLPNWSTRFTKKHSSHDFSISVLSWAQAACDCETVTGPTETFDIPAIGAYEGSYGLKVMESEAESEQRKRAVLILVVSKHLKHHLRAPYPRDADL
jgi:hypothetical protein